MITKLANDFITYINHKHRRNQQLQPIVLGNITVPNEQTQLAEFDIIDKQKPVIVTPKEGSVTYHNPTNKEAVVVNYEEFLNQFPNHTKGMKRADFIVYEANGNSFFIINELSQSSNIASKRSDAKRQLHAVVRELRNCLAIKTYTDGCQQKICLFSNRHQPIQTPMGMANAFAIINQKIETSDLGFQPITKLGFKGIESDHFTI